jgi:hypothetical protein
MRVRGVTVRTSMRFMLRFMMRRRTMIRFRFMMLRNRMESTGNVMSSSLDRM